MYKNKVIRNNIYKNLKYISLLQLYATLAKPSKMHKNRPLVVYPATLVPLKEGACPEYKSSKINQKIIAYPIYAHI
jgi:hypothetical protein